MHETPRQKTFSLLPKIINSGVSGIIALLVLFPLDLVKTRMQNQSPNANGELLYNNMCDCFRKTLKTEGVLGLYSGLGISLLLIAPKRALRLSSNDFFRYHLTEQSGHITLLNEVIAGSCAGLLQGLIATPLELIKILMQDVGRRKALGESVEHLSMSQVIHDIVEENGMFGLCKGIVATQLREVLFHAMYFPLFAHLNDFGPRKDDNSGESVALVSFTAGFISAAVAAFLTTPLDVLKTRIQAGECLHGIWQCCMKTLRNEGVVAFFKGSFLRVLVIAPTMSIMMVFYYIGVAEWMLGIKKGT